MSAYTDLLKELREKNKPARAAGFRVAPARSRGVILSDLCKKAGHF